MPVYWKCTGKGKLYWRRIPLLLQVLIGIRCFTMSTKNWNLRRGELFVANCRQDNVFIFSKSGHFVKQFGQRGEGPGDLYSIGNLGILDEKHLLVSEAPQRKRLSLFGLDGQFRKVVKTKYPVYHAVALKNNKIAYLTYSWETSGNNGGKRKQKNRIILKDLDSNRERILQSVSLVEKRVIKDSSRSGIYLKNFVGNVFIRRSKEGNLLVGVSNSPELVIYSPEGKRLKSIRLTLPRRKVQDAYIQRYKKMQIQSMEADPFYSRNKRLINFVKGYPFEKVFDEYLPFYHEILVDSLGNFLVFKWPKNSRTTMRFSRYTRERARLFARRKSTKENLIYLWIAALKQ